MTASRPTWRRTRRAKPARWDRRRRQAQRRLELAALLAWHDRTIDPYTVGSVRPGR